MKLTPEQRKQMNEDVRSMLLSAVARKYGVSRQTVLNYLREDFLDVRRELIAKGVEESEATLKAYEEVYKCRQQIKTVEG